MEVAESRAPIIPAKTASKSMLDNIDTIADGMLLPPLCAQADYVNYAKEAGLEVSGGPKDISEDVKATWSVHHGANPPPAFNTDRLTRSCASGISRGHWSRTHPCGPLRSARAGMGLLSCRHSVRCEGDMQTAAFGTLLFRSRSERGSCAGGEQPDWQQPVSIT